MQKEISYEVKRKIEWLPLLPEFDAVAYIERIYENDELVKENEGIASLAEIESQTINSRIQNLRIRVKQKKEEVEIGVILTKNGRDLFRLNHMGSTDGLKKIQEGVINCPYTHIKEHGTEGTEALLMNYGALQVYDIHGTLLPTPVYFDYIQANVDNRYYDLEELSKSLVERHDIEIIYDRGQKGVIKDIPYYNSEPERDRCIEFFWYPVEEDFAKVRKTMERRTFNRHEVIIETVFGVSKINK